jgi:hypothetical protein
MLYDQDIPAVKIGFEEIGVHQIDAMTVKCSAKFSSGTAERQFYAMEWKFGTSVPTPTKRDFK